MPEPIAWLTGFTLAAAALVYVGKYIVAPLVKMGETMKVVESHTKQLTTNGGGHLADVVRSTSEKVESFDAKWDARQHEIDQALVTQQEKVRVDLERHRNETAEEFTAVWRELATRDIHRSADLLSDVARRAEQSLLRRRAEDEGPSRGTVGGN